MDLYGQTIQHKKFGRGVVTAFNDNTVTVRFKEGEKRFLYPDAFRRHLSFECAKMQQTVATRIEKEDAEIQRRLQRESEEQQRLWRLQNFTVTANSHAVWNLPPEKADALCKKRIVTTGKYLTGCSKGKTRTAERLKPNSACLLTVRRQGEPEEKREILGAFMVREDYFGAEARDDRIQSHPEHYLMLSKGEIMRFWENMGRGTIPRWGNTVFKYCSGAAMNRILSRMVQAQEQETQRTSAFAFYRYFCRLNHLRPLAEEELPEK